jgi:hypothetical protein
MEMACGQISHHVIWYYLWYFHLNYKEINLSWPMQDHRVSPPLYWIRITFIDWRKRSKTLPVVGRNGRGLKLFYIWSQLGHTWVAKAWVGETVEVAAKSTEKRKTVAKTKQLRRNRRRSTCEDGLGLQWLKRIHGLCVVEWRSNMQ